MACLIEKCSFFKNLSYSVYIFKHLKLRATSAHDATDRVLAASNSYWQRLSFDTSCRLSLLLL